MLLPATGALHMPVTFYSTPSLIELTPVQPPHFCPFVSEVVLSGPPLSFHRSDVLCAQPPPTPSLFPL